MPYPNTLIYMPYGVANKILTCCVYACDKRIPTRALLPIYKLLTLLRTHNEAISCVNIYIVDDLMVRLFGFLVIENCDMVAAYNLYT